MPFVEIKRGQSAKGEVGDAVAMGVYVADGKEIKTRSVIFFISRSVAAKLGWEIIDHRFPVTLHEGVGSDQGFLMITPGVDGQGYTATGGNKSTHRTALKFAVVAQKFNHYTLNDTRVATHPVTYVIDNNSLIIECPDWLKFNPLTAPLEPAPEPKPETRVSISTPQPHVFPKRRGRPPKGGHRYS
jgi:hypothetical protein